MIQPDVIIEVVTAFSATKGKKYEKERKKERKKTAFSFRCSMWSLLRTTTKLQGSCNLSLFIVSKNRHGLKN